MKGTSFCCPKLARILTACIDPMPIIGNRRRRMFSKAVARNEMLTLAKNQKNQDVGILTQNNTIFRVIDGPIGEVHSTADDISRPISHAVFSTVIGVRKFVPVITMITPCRCSIASPTRHSIEAGVLARKTQAE